MTLNERANQKRWQGMERESFDDFVSVMKEKNGERVSLEEEADEE
jgi:hypothetical protein